MSFESSASKLPAQASLIRCFLSFATRAFVSRYFNARNGQSNRFTVLSRIPGAPGTGVSAADDLALASETAVRLVIVFFKKLRRLIRYIGPRSQSSSLIPFLRKMG